MSYVQKSLLFLCYRQSIFLTIIKEDSYEKDVLFYVQLGDPEMSGGKQKIIMFKQIIESKKAKQIENQNFGRKINK